MGIFSKIAFWKSEEPLPGPGDFGKFDMSTPDLGLPAAANDLGLPSSEGMPGMPEMPSGLGKPQQAGPEAPQSFPRLEESMPQPRQEFRQPSYGEVSGKDLEIISLKLDSMKRTLESINERLAALEKMAKGEAESPRF